MFQFLLGTKTKLPKAVAIFCTIKYFQVPVSVDFSFETKPE